jgi:histone acetyltransferase (RNA polymerase elongator complex component)
MITSSKERKLHRKRVRACRRKRKYHSFEEAAVRAHQWNREGHYIEVYQCKICGGWHLAKMKKYDRVMAAFDRLAAQV